MTPNPTKCPACGGKGYYSYFHGGGTFGDSFDGHITIQPKIENHPCPKCQKPPGIPVKDETTGNPGDIPKCPDSDHSKHDCQTKEDWILQAVREANREQKELIAASGEKGWEEEFKKNTEDWLFGFESRDGDEYNVTLSECDEETLEKVIEFIRTEKEKSRREALKEAIERLSNYPCSCGCDSCEDYIRCDLEDLIN